MTPRGKPTRPPSGDDFGDRVRRLRLERELTQQQLAEKSGVPQVTISAIEVKRRARPLLETVEALANALGVTASYLAGTDEPIEPALAEFLRTRRQPGGLCPADITEDEIARLRRSRVVLGPAATPRTYAVLLEVIRGTLQH